MSCATKTGSTEAQASVRRLSYSYVSLLDILRVLLLSRIHDRLRGGQGKGALANHDCLLE